MSDTNDVLAVELIIEDGAFDAILKKNETKLANFGANARPKVNLSAVEKSFNELEKTANQTRTTLENAVKVRLDAGNVNSYTKELFRAQEQAKQLLSVIQSTRTALSQTTDKSLIKIYLQDLKAAETELGQLQRKQQTVLSGQNRTADASGANSGVEKFGKIRGFGAVFREFAPAVVTEGLVNAGLTGIDLLNTSLAATSVAATTATGTTAALTTATTAQGAAAATTATAVGAETTAFAGLSIASLGVFAAVAAAGYGIVKISENIRAEAERRLHVEESIAGIINRQIISQREVLANFAQSRKDIEENKNFQNNLQTSDLESLERQRNDLEARLKITQPKLTVFDEKGKAGLAANKDFDQITHQLLDIDAQIRTQNENKRKAADDNFRQQTANDQRSLENSIAYERKRSEEAIAAQKKRTEEIEKAKTKFKELEKAALNAFDGLYQKTGANNPFVSLFTEADKSLRTLRENIKSLPPELQKIAEEMQQKINSNSLFSARLDNRLNVFDLRESADAFRNPKKEFDAAAEKARTESIAQTAFESGIAGRIRAERGEFGKLSDAQKQQVYQQAGLDYVGQLNQSGSTFNSLNQSSLISRFASESRQNPNLSLQERLQKQFDIVDNLRGTAKTDDEKSIADRRIIALTQGLNPNQLTDSEREKAAVARENEAVRASGAEKNAKAERAEDRKIQQQIADNTKRFLDLAEKEGLKAVLEIVDKTGGGINLQTSPTNKDTQVFYNQ